jgi:hypothetical protein
MNCRIILPPVAADLLPQRVLCDFWVLVQRFLQSRSGDTLAVS